MEIATAVGGALLSPAFQVLLESLSSLDLLNYARQGQVLDELSKWEQILKKIYAVLDDAEDKQMTDKSVQLWVSELRDLAYDLEDLLDEFATEALRRKGKGDEPVASTSKVRKFIPSCCVGFKPSAFKFNAEMLSKIGSISKKLDEILERKDLLSLGAGCGRDMANGQGSERLPATSLVNEAKVYGRDEDRKAVLEMLKSETSEEKVSVIAIVGMGGIGKTTLAQLVYSDDSTNVFDLKAWVSVGEDFDVLRITKTLVNLEGSDEKDLNSLQVKLKEKLSGKKFLIVLDDVWTQNYDRWTLFNLPLESGAQGSKIIVTTRNRGVSSMVGAIQTYPLKELSYDDCYSLFAQHALGVVNFDKHLVLKESGEEMVKRCRGLPLAAKALGGLLRGKPNLHLWERVLKSRIWELESNVLPALRLSYYHLPSYLKQCFAYCAIFPDEYEFDKEELVLLWMAEGFLQQPKQNQLVEDLGSEYFEDLLSRSFFQGSSKNKSLYVMHDLIRDLARSVSGETSLHLDNKLVQEKSFGSVRHSLVTHGRYDMSTKCQVLKEMKKLRTFIALSVNKYMIQWYINRNVPHNLLLKLKCLRVLSLAGYGLPELPNSIGSLKLLRYLNLSKSEIVQLPTSLCELFNLQTLRLCECYKLIELPTDIDKLSSLRHLDIRGTENLKGIPLQIGNLRNLQSLGKFMVGGNERPRLGELGKFPYLKGELDITGLQNVVNVQDAEFANLKEKQGLNMLELKWSRNSKDTQNDEIVSQVLKLLQPHTNLESLSISSYGGKSFPSWLGDISFRNMVIVELNRCPQIVTLPSLGQLPCLRELSMEGMPQVKEVGAEFYGSGMFSSLETLWIEDFCGWEKWSCSTGNNGENEGKFPKLRELTLINCPRLVSELPSCLPSLHQLRIEECQDVILRSVCSLTSLVNFYIRRISGLVNLDEINIGAMVGLEELKIHKLSLVEGGEELLPCNLQTLEIDGCDQVVKLLNGLHRLTSLRDMKISNCPKLLSLAAMDFPSSLTRLDILNCDSLEEIIVHSKEEIRHVEYFRIYGCPSLRSLSIGEFVDSLKSTSLCYCTIDLLESPSGRLSHLTSLELNGCPNLDRFPDKGLPTPTLVDFRINGCENLSALPNHMPELQSLLRLSIYNCNSLVSFPEDGLAPNVEVLNICNCMNLSQPMSEWGLCALSSLQSLQIIGACPSTDMVVSFPDDGEEGQLLPSSLMFLTMDGFQNLKSLSAGFQKLTSLQYLSIGYNPKLKSLPKEGFPASLSSLQIRSCPLLKEGCEKDKGVFWPIILHIPLLSIDNTII